jgi:serine/threonine-protein kinase
VTSVPPPAKYEAGALIGGKYRLERKLGEGGMGAVWAAHHVALDTAIAIKLIRSDTNRKELAPRLLQEARAAAKLGHPAIVRVFDVGQTSDGEPFIVMELLEGESLNERLEREHRLSAVEAVRLLLPIADALRAAHGKGIVHRDIKPDNVFLVKEETGVQPKLVDFGIAKLAAREFDSQITERGVILGSPDYMAPEQARGREDIDRRADVWSFCVLLYETISGQPPFDGNNYNALLRAIVEATPATLLEMYAADAELSQIVATGLEKDRERRFQSMQALGEALARWLLKYGVFEDAAGGAVEAKWLQRNSEANHRQSRPSFGSIPGFASTMPGLEPIVGTATERRLVAEAPTTAGPPVTLPRRATKRPRFALALLGIVSVAALSVRLFSRSPSERVPKVAPALAATQAAQPPSIPVGEAPPPPPATDEHVPEALADGPDVPNTAPTRGAALPASRANQRFPRASSSASTQKPAAAPAASAPKPALDLLTPY